MAANRRWAGRATQAADEVLQKCYGCGVYGEFGMDRKVMMCAASTRRSIAGVTRAAVPSAGPQSEKPRLVLTMKLPRR